MGLAHPTVLPAPGTVLEGAKRTFFAYFFHLVIAFVALAEWVTVAWVLHAGGVAVPVVLHLTAPVAVYAVNRWLVRRRAAVHDGPRPLLDAPLHAYAGFAFTTIFCALVLACGGLLWCAGALAAPLLPAALVPRLARAHFWLLNAGVGATAALLLYGHTLGPRALTVTRLRVRVPGLPPAFAGFRIVHVSDLHIGPHLRLAELARHVARVNALDPDLVCVTGDLVDRPETCAFAFPTLAGLSARHGVLVTLGNHDFYAGADVVTDELRRCTGFTVLRNARTTVRRDGAALTVLGLDDAGLDWARGLPAHPALPRLAAAVPDGQPFIVLSHRPDCFPQAARLGAALVLSGHTHGGQLGLPALRGRRVRNLAEFITAFDRGLYRRGGATLYVSRGLGFTGQRVRVFTPREIAVVDLQPA